MKYLLICRIFVSIEFKEVEENLSQVRIHLCFLKCAKDEGPQTTAGKMGTLNVTVLGQTGVWASNYLMLASG